MMSAVFTQLTLLFGWLPAWFTTFVMCFVAIMLLLLVLKIVAFVLDCIPLL